MVVKADPHLLDYGCVRINCFVDAQLRIIIVKLSWNREIIEEVICKDINAELQHSINELLHNEPYIPCKGFSDQHSDGLFDIFARLRKNDIPFILLEKYNGGLIYRSRNCSYVIESSKIQSEEEAHNQSIFKNRCKNCQEFYTLIDNKYGYGQFATSGSQSSQKEETEESQDLSTPPVSNKASSLDTDECNLKDPVILKENPDLNMPAQKRLLRKKRSRYKDVKYKDFVVETAIGEDSQLEDSASNSDRKLENNENLPLYAEVRFRN